MKILMATMGMDIGGAETHVVELSRELARQGHEIIVASNGGAYVSALTSAGIRHFCVPMHRRNVFYMLQSRKLLKQIIRDEKPDLVHAHARIPAFLCGTLQKKFHFPFVTTCHGVYQMSSTLKLLSNWGQRTLAVSEDVQEYLLEQYYLPREQIRLTINGIPPHAVDPSVNLDALRQELSLVSGPVLGHVSRIDPETVLVAQLLTEIAPSLAEAIPNLQILIVGGGESFAALQQLAQKANQKIGRNCLVLTDSRTDISELLSLCDCFVGVSRAALEAMAAGIPAVLSGKQGHTGLFTEDGLQDAIDTNFCCRSHPEPTAKTLLESLLELLHLPEAQRQELASYGMQVVAEHYSIARMTEDSLTMYAQVLRKDYHVLMSGYYGFSNSGDDAILQAIHHGILATGNHVSVTVLSGSPAETKNLYGLNALPRLNIPAIFRAMRRCDALISGGGSLLQDRTSTRSLLYYLFIIRLAQWFGKPVMLYANGIGPVQKPGNRRRVRSVVEKATVVTLRDQNSAQELREMGIAREDLHVTADPVFRLVPASTQRAQELLESIGMNPRQNFVAISVRDWSVKNQFPRQLAALCEHLYHAHGLATLFILMQPKKDLDISRRVRQSMTTPSYLLDLTTTPAELMAVLGQAKLCVAMRLHTLIFAARMSVPSLGLVYDPKVSSYLEELSMPSAGNVTDFDEAHAIRTADALMENYAQAKEQIAARSGALSATAAENELLLLDMLAQTEPE